MSVYADFHAAAAQAGLVTSMTPGADIYDGEFDSILALPDAAEHSLRAGGFAVIGNQRLDANTVLQRTDRHTRLDSAGNQVRETDDELIRRSVLEAHLSYENEVFAQRAAGTRMDALVPQASQALVSFDPQVYVVRHVETRAYLGQYLPIFRRVNRAAEKHVWYQTDLQGVAKAASTYAEDSIPLVAGPSAGENSVNIMPFLVGFKVNFMDERRSQMAVQNGKPNFRINERKRGACVRVIAEAIDKLWLYGDPNFAIDGLINYPFFESVSLPNGNWATATGIQQMTDLTFILTRTASQTIGDLGDYSKVRIDLPFDAYNRAATTPYTAAGSSNVLPEFKRAFGLRDDQVRAKHEIKAVNSVAYNGGPQNLSEDTAFSYYFDDGAEDDEMSGDASFVLAQPIEQPTAPMQTGLGFVQFMHARAGGIRVPDTRRVRRFTGFGPLP